jgi:tetratricopeptide (TPR) repeat protein
MFLPLKNKLPLVDLVLVFVLIVCVNQLNAQKLDEGDSLFAFGYYDKAIKTYELSNDPIKNFKIAKVHEINGNFKEAQLYLEKYIEKDSNNTLVNFTYGKILQQQKQNKKAISVFQELTKKYKNPTYFYYLGICYEQNQKPKNAYENYKEVVRLDNLHLKGNYKIALFDLRSEKWDTALETIEKIIPLHPENIEFILLKAQCLYGKSEYKNAKEAFEKLITLNYIEQFVYEKIALCWMKLNEYQKSIDTYESLMIQFEHIDNPDFHYNIGLNYGYLKNLKLAEKHFMISKKLKTATFEKEYFSIALFNQENGNLTKALTYYNKTIQEAPEYLEAHFQIALITDETSKDLNLKLKTYENFKTKFPDMDNKKLAYVDHRITELKKEIHFKG